MATDARAQTYTYTYAYAYAYTHIHTQTYIDTYVDTRRDTDTLPVTDIGSSQTVTHLVHVVDRLCVTCSEGH